MGILNDFYTTISTEKLSENSHLAKIRLNPRHEIFRGHFPGNPVTPGVCMIQIVTDLAEGIFGKKLMLESAANVKFMAIINPEENPELEIELETAPADGRLKVKSSARFGDTTALKMGITYKIL